MYKNVFVSSQRSTKSRDIGINLSKWFIIKALIFSCISYMCLFNIKIRSYTYWEKKCVDVFIKWWDFYLEICQIIFFTAEMHSEPTQPYKIELFFVKMVNNWKRKDLFTKSSILDVWQDSKCARELLSQLCESKMIWQSRKLYKLNNCFCAIWSFHKSPFAEATNGVVL